MSIFPKKGEPTVEIIIKDQDREKEISDEMLTDCLYVQIPHSALMTHMVGKVTDTIYVSPK